MPKLICASLHETVRTTDPKLLLYTSDLVSCIAVIFYGKYKCSLTHYVNSSIIIQGQGYSLTDASIEAFIKRETAWINSGDKLQTIFIVNRKGDIDGLPFALYFKEKIKHLQVTIKEGDVTTGCIPSDNDTYSKMIRAGVAFEPEYSENLDRTEYSNQNNCEIILKESIQPGSAVPYVRYQDGWLPVPPPAQGMLAKFNKKYFLNEGATLLAKQAGIPLRNAQISLEYQDSHVNFR